MTAMIIDASGVRPAADALEVGKQVAAGRFFWLDISGGDPSAHHAFLTEAGLNAADAAWALRFGQAGRMQIGVEGLRAVTWIADRAGNVIELHLIGREKCITTLWGGDPATLDDIRWQFAERLGGIENNLYEAAGILLQLLLGTLGSAFQAIDMKLDGLRLALGGRTGAPDSAALAERLQALQSTAASFNRYLASVRAATTGIETVHGAGVRGAEELDDYADQVEDVEQQLFERRQWMSNIIHDFSAEIARKQSEQINRLTLVSLIFLPVTALTGFFGMNFNWLIASIASGEAFLILGVLLPLLGVVLTIAWLWRRDIIRFRL
ncbi:MAG: CorA family divalent cation transporter [Pseudolabrys sp.]